MLTVTEVNAHEDKYEVAWPVHQVRSKAGRYYEGRPETVAALAGPGFTLIRSDERVFSGTRAQCEAQL